MDDQVKESITIAINLIVISALLTVAIIFATSSRALINVNVQEKSYQEVIDEYKNLYMYDNKQLTGADIPEAMIKYARNYNFEVVIDGISHKIIENTYTIDEAIQYTDEKIIWTEEYIVNTILGNNIYDAYTSELVRDSYGIISGIQFTKE